MRWRAPGVARLASAIPYVVLFFLGAYLYVDAGTFARFARPGELGPDFWPRAILVVLMVVCGAATLQRLLSTRIRDAEAYDAQQTIGADDVQQTIGAEDREQPSTAPTSAEPAAHPFLLAGGIALSVAYVAALDTLGFFVATALYLGIFMMLGRYRRVGVITATSVVGSLVFVVVFMKIVYVSLPLGQGPFRAFSAALLALLGVR